MLYEEIRYHGFSKVSDEKPDENILALVCINTDLRSLINQQINNKKAETFSFYIPTLAHPLGK